MLDPDRQRLRAYSVAVLSTVAATLLRLALSPLLGTHAPFTLYFVSISFTAWFCGLGPSLAAVFLGALAADLFFVERSAAGLTWISHIAVLAAYVLVGILISVLSGSTQRSRRRAEAAAEALREGQEQMTGIIGSAMDGIITVNDDQRITMFNAAAELIFGCSAAEAIDQPIDRFIPDRFRSAHRRHMVTFGQANATRRSMGSLGAISALRANGEEFPIEASISHVTAGGRKLYTVILRDITGRKRAEQEREELLRREREARMAAESASRLKDEFLATVSHELRTPLNAILGWARMLRTGKLDPSTADKALESVERNARAQAQIIEDILDVSRIITGKLRLEFRPLQLRSVVESAMDTIRLTADVKGIRTRLVQDQAVGPVLGDLTRLQQVFWNLLSNAVKFTSGGGLIEVTLEQSDSVARVRIRDTGRGISPEFLRFVFDRFRQADSSSTRKYGGLGLGLSIVRHIIELHGGNVEADSPGEGGGATFTVELPLAAAYGNELVQSGAGDHRPAESAVASGFSCPRELGGLHILVVDDEPDTLQVVKTALANCGAEVTTCVSAQEALDAVDRSIPDLLISDIAMPDEDGFSLIRRLRAREPGSGGNIPAAALTAYARVEDRMQVLSAGFQMFVPKPVEPDELVDVVASLALQKRV
jgi:PAS domain S-box-containing protein